VAQSPQSALNERMVAPVVTKRRASGGW